MAKYYDVRGMGKSKLCPKLPDENESSSDRHWRRKNFNFQRTETVGKFCTKNNLHLKITNFGHHWKVTGANKTIQWWPASAKVVIDKLWQRGIHCHDYEQFIEILKKQFKIKGE